MSRGYSVWILVALSLSVFFPVHPIPINSENVSNNQNTTGVLGVVTKFVGFFKLLESKLHKNSGQYPPSTSSPLGGQPWRSSTEPPTNPAPSDIFPDDTLEGHPCNISPQPPTNPTPSEIYPGNTGDGHFCNTSTELPPIPTPGDSRVIANSSGVGTLPPSDHSPGHTTSSSTEVLFEDNFNLPFARQKMIDAPVNMVSRCGQGLQKDGSGLCRRVW